MDYKELIEHILGNANSYLAEYKKKEELSEYEKGILHGLWMDIDSIKNQLEIEKIDGHKKEALNLEKELQLEKIMNNLENLFME